jgi:hypothetical protein
MGLHAIRQLGQKMRNVSAKKERRRDVMRKTNAAVTAVGGSLLLALLMLGSAQAADTSGPKSGSAANDRGDGHVDPCWSLRLQRHRDAYAWLRFEDCLAHHNYNN